MKNSTWRSPGPGDSSTWEERVLYEAHVEWIRKLNRLIEAGARYRRECALRVRLGPGGVVTEGEKRKRL